MSRDIKQLQALFLTDPDGGSMEISSDLRDAGNGDNSRQFTVTNPETGRRFAITFGIAELISQDSKAHTNIALLTAAHPETAAIRQLAEGGKQ